MYSTRLYQLCIDVAFFFLLTNHHIFHPFSPITLLFLAPSQAVSWFRSNITNQQTYPILLMLGLKFFFLDLLQDVPLIVIHCATPQEDLNAPKLVC